MFIYLFIFLYIFIYLLLSFAIHTLSELYSSSSAGIVHSPLNNLSVMGPTKLSFKVLYLPLNRRVIFVKGCKMLCFAVLHSNHSQHAGWFTAHPTLPHTHTYTHLVFSWVCVVTDAQHALSSRDGTRQPACWWLELHLGRHPMVVHQPLDRRDDLFPFGPFARHLVS